jgi:hypothetical protein
MTQNKSPAGSRITYHECTRCTRSAPRRSSRSTSATRSSVWMSRCTRAVPSPRRCVSSQKSWPCSAVILGVVEPRQRLADGRLPERQLAIMLAGGYVNNNLEQPTEVRHGVNLCQGSLPGRRTRQPTRPWSRAPGGRSKRLRGNARTQLRSASPRRRVDLRKAFGAAALRQRSSQDAREQPEGLGMFR